MKDTSFRTQKFSRGISPVTITDNTAQVSQIIDRAGFDSLTFLLAVGTLADADATTVVLVEDGDAANLSDAAAVSDAKLAGTELLAAPIFSDDDKVFKIGYLGTKRYVRVTVTPSGNTGSFPLAGLWVLGDPTDPPYSTQKV